MYMSSNTNTHNYTNTHTRSTVMSHTTNQTTNLINELTTKLSTKLSIYRRLKGPPMAPFGFHLRSLPTRIIFRDSLKAPRKNF